MTTEALDRARTVLRDNKDKLQALAARLLSQEVIEEEEMKIILGPKVRRPDSLLHDRGTMVAPHDPDAEAPPAAAGGEMNSVVGEPPHR